MSGKLEGTYPRRLVKRTHNRNPTFQSYNLFGLLQPDQNGYASSTQKIQIKQTVKPNYSFNNIFGADIQPHTNLFIQSYLPQDRKPYLADHAQKSLSKANNIENGNFTIRSKSTSVIDVDSLHAAENEFNKKKLRNPQSFIFGSNQGVEEKRQSRILMKQSPNPTKQLSIKRCQSIVDKQSKDFNIISNIGFS